MALNKHLEQPTNLLLVEVRLVITVAGGGEVDDTSTGRSCLIVVAGQCKRGATADVGIGAVLVRRSSTSASSSSKRWLRSA